MGGCIGGPQRPTSARIIEQINRIKLVSAQQQIKWQRSYRSQEDLLKSSFLKEVHYRNLGVEKAQIGQIVYGMNMHHIYSVIEGEAKKLIEYKTLLQKEETLNNVKPSVDVLMYCSTFLNNDEISKFYFLIKNKYPKYTDPIVSLSLFKDSDVKDEIIRHHRRTEVVTPKMEYEYVMEFCQNNDFPLEKINAVGHNYRYGAA